MPASLHPAGYAPGFVARILDMARDGGGRTGGRRVFAIAGLQGTGKSTLSQQLEALGREVHPLCATRGAPGTTIRLDAGRRVALGSTLGGVPFDVPSSNQEHTP